VAPCVWIGGEDTRGAAADDPGQRPQAAYVPRWWHFDVSEAPGAVSEAPVVKVKNEAQLPLPVIVSQAVTTKSVGLTQVAAVPRSAFGGSAVLEARAKAAERRQVVDAVEVLLERGSVMSGDAFAAAMRVLPFRVGGLISKLQEVLNLDGYEVIRYDAGTRQVHLDRAKLAQLFEVTL
jgi:hypothetical protein